ncbi:hypothetical protein LJC01_02215 [Clostridiaceae bacterium OttesenSCG-928-D20]|nr:hypothetical protein [Clostridiaceae bacterium OttesenSCG-928-D20]
MNDLERLETPRLEKIAFLLLSELETSNKTAGEIDGAGDLLSATEKGGLEEGDNNASALPEEAELLDKNRLLDEERFAEGSAAEIFEDITEELIEKASEELDAEIFSEESLALKNEAPPEQSLDVRNSSEFTSKDGTKEAGLSDFEEERIEKTVWGGGAKLALSVSGEREELFSRQRDRAEGSSDFSREMMIDIRRYDNAYERY